MLATAALAPPSIVLRWMPPRRAPSKTHDKPARRPPGLTRVLTLDGHASAVPHYRSLPFVWYRLMAQPCAAPPPGLLDPGPPPTNWTSRPATGWSACPYRHLLMGCLALSKSQSSCYCMSCVCACSAQAPAQLNHFSHLHMHSRLIACTRRSTPASPVSGCAPKPSSGRQPQGCMATLASRDIHPSPHFHGSRVH